MSTKRSLPPLTFAAQPRTALSLPYQTLKRKFALSTSPREEGELSYPSPPMSSPPSSPKSTVQQQAGAVIRPSTLGSANVASSFSPNASLTTPSPLIQTTAPTHTQRQPGTFLDRPPLGSSQPDSNISHFQPYGTQSSGYSITTAAPAFSGHSVATGQSDSRSGRQSKAHVASACVNCKRAHLSCDVQRPCARCVSSGKQDTCYDVQHKKRGRPRLREEGEIKIDQMVPDQAPSTSIPSAAAGPSSRPIAAPRRRRTDSLRSLPSQAGEGSSLGYAARPPPPSALQSSFNYSQPANIPLTPSDIPTAFLDLDLVVLRANRPFQQIMSNDQNLTGRQIGDITIPADYESFQDIRNRLKAERDHREPSYMPPMLSPAQDPLQGVSEAHIDRLTHGFADRMQTWTRDRSGSIPETFPARVRLGKALTYFVVVTLPTFRPQPPQPPPLLSMFAVDHPSAMPGYTIPAPGAVQHPAAITKRVASESPHSITSAYPPSQRGTPYQPPTISSTPQLPIIEPPTDASAFTPQALGRDIMQPPAPDMQLPPIGSTTRIADKPPEERTAVNSHHRGSSSEPEDGRSSKKRRRMDIDEVLQ